MINKIDYDKRSIDPVTDYPLLIEAVFVALKNIGGEGTNQEIEDEVIRILDLTDEQVNRCDSDSSKPEFSHCLSWSKTYLKRYGAINNYAYKKWEITDEFSDRKAFSYEKAKEIYNCGGYREEGDDDIGETYSEDEFKEMLLGSLQHMNAFDFEQLCGDLLRAYGFINVAVTKRTKDGGFDGKADLEGLGLGKLPAIYQCKKYYPDKKVNLDEVNAFAGIGDDFNKSAIRIYITTYEYTQDAITRAERADANIITIDGHQLVDLLLEKGIGCKKVTITGYQIDEDYFESLDAKERTE